MTLMDVTTRPSGPEPGPTPLGTYAAGGESARGIEATPVVLALLAGEDEENSREPHIWRGID